MTIPIYYTGSLTPSSGSGGGGSIDSFIDGGTVVEGLFSDLPTFISGLAGKVSNGTITYKITQNETIDENTSTLTMGILLTTIPKWGIPEVIIDGDEKTITLETGVVFISPDYDFENEKFITGFNDITQTLTFKNLNISINAESDIDVTNMANINMKFDSCTITSIGEDAAIVNSAGYMEAYYCEFENNYTGAKNAKGIKVTDTGKCLTYSNTFRDYHVAIEVSHGGQIQAINDIYDNCTTAVESRKSGIGTLCTDSTVTGSKVTQSNTNTLGGIVYN